MKRVKTPFAMAILTIFALWTLTALSAGAVEPPSMNVTGTQISWYSEASTGYKLTISGPGGVQHHVFEGGEAPILSVFDEGGYPREDGSYTWELRALPTHSRGQSEVQWGYVTIQNGEFLARELEEAVGDQPNAPFKRDQVVADDLIVQGSACIGVDCADGENFDLDTLRLKEDTLRIKFEDTSTGSFPSNDWQFTANDSISGGGDRFSIDDVDSGHTPFTIEAGAPSNSLYVDDAGRLGLGTATPSGPLHITGDSMNAPELYLESTDGAQKTWRIRNTPGNGRMTFNDVGGSIPFKFASNAQNNLLRVGIVDTGFGSADNANTVSVGTSVPGENTAVLDVYGSIRVNGSSALNPAPSARLHLVGNLDADSEPNILLESTAGAAETWEIRNTPANGRLTFSDDPTGARVPFKFGPDADNNLLRVGVDFSDMVEINGTLNISGAVVVDGTTVHADYVFQPDYDLPSIEEHAEFMWQKSHLPSLPKAPADNAGPVDLVSHQMGILEELETAHIYIDQLNNLVKSQDHQLKEQSQMLREQSRLLLEQSLALEDLQQRLASLERPRG